MRQPYLLLFCLLAVTSFAQNTTQNSIRPLECYHADSDSQSLTVATTFATVWYVVPYRVLPPVLTMIKTCVAKPSKDNLDDPQAHSRAMRIFLSVLDAAIGPINNDYVFTTVAQAGSVISFLVPLYWINRSYHSTAECEYEKQVRLSPNTTLPKSCYRKDAEENIFSTTTAYSFGLSIGVYTLMPVLFALISGCLKKNKPREPTEAAGGLGAGLAAGLEVGGAMSTGQRPFFDSAWVTPVLAFLTPLWGWAQWFRSQAECDYDKQFMNQTST